VIAMRDEVVIAGAATIPGVRRPEPEVTTQVLLGRAFRLALGNAGLEPRAVDGLGVASFGLRPDRAVDLAWKLGIRLRWVMDDSVGLNLLAHAVHALAAGEASTIVLVGGDSLVGSGFEDVATNLNRTARDYLSVLPTGGPNALFALVTRAHMAAHGLGREAYGQVVLSQRSWAACNPAAVYRSPLTMADYLAAPVVAEPLCLYDCVPIVAGAEAVVLTIRAGDGRRERSAVRIRALETVVNHDGQDGDGLTTGLDAVAERLWTGAGLSPGEVDIAAVYDDYPVMVLAQLSDLGLSRTPDAAALMGGAHGRARPSVNTSGGQLSAGQSGAGGTLHGLVECVLQLRGERGQGQVTGARTAVVASSTLAIYRYGACAAAAVLERK
jgi:acetyl-CoA acetyltransferase